MIRWYSVYGIKYCILVTGITANHYTRSIINAHVRLRWTQARTSPHLNDEHSMYGTKDRCILSPIASPVIVNHPEEEIYKVTS